MSILRSECKFFTRLPNPLQESLNIKNYFAIVDVKSLFDLEPWRNINVRDPKEHGPVPEAIRDSLKENELFFIMNRGLTITAKSVHFDNQKNILALELEDEDIHGLLDGGHTYIQIKRYNESQDENLIANQFIKIEVITGLDRSAAVSVVEARNTSNAVKQTSLEELKGTFKDLQTALKDQPYANRIAYKETEFMVDEDGKKVPKPISVLDILTCLICFDLEEFSDQKHPLQIATHKNAVLDHFAEHPSRWKSFYPILPGILRLWDGIWRDFRECYNSTGGRLKGWKWVKDHPRKPKKLFFIEGEVDYSFADSLRLPILAAFRCAIEKKNGVYVWKGNMDPVHFFKTIVGSRLTKTLVDSMDEIKDVTRASRTESIWSMCYVIFENALMKEGVIV